MYDGSFLLLGVYKQFLVIEMLTARFLFMSSVYPYCQQAPTTPSLAIWILRIVATPQWWLCHIYI